MAGPFVLLCRRMQGVHPDIPAHPDGVAYMVPAGMLFRAVRGRGAQGCLYCARVMYTGESCKASNAK